MDEDLIQKLLLIGKITPYTDKELKEYPLNKKIHRCVLPKIGYNLEDCRFQHEKELNVGELKLHFVTHYTNSYRWNNIIQMEGENQGTIDFYKCNL